MAQQQQQIRAGDRSGNPSKGFIGAARQHGSTGSVDSNRKFSTDSDQGSSSFVSKRFVSQFHDGARRMSQAEFHQGNEGYDMFIDLYGQTCPQVIT
jgi:hypothetical protein